MDQNKQLSSWFASGAPWVWLSAAAVAISIFMVSSLLILLLLRGFGHFWPSPVAQFEIQGQPMLGEFKHVETVPAIRLRDMGMQVADGQISLQRQLVKTGNRDLSGADFRWIMSDDLIDAKYPKDVFVAERREWGNFYGYLHSINENGKALANGEKAWDALAPRLERTKRIFEQIRHVEKVDIGKVNFALEKLRLKTREYELKGALTKSRKDRISEERKRLKQNYQRYQSQLNSLYKDISRDSLTAASSNGRIVEIPLQKIVRVYQPNSMSIVEKLGFYLGKFWEFISDEPREANTEGGIFPAIFGTVLMVLVMSVMVTPFGVVAAVYLREYAKQGLLTRLIRIAVNNLAGVPSIVYGIFGLGFFVYFLGGNIDQLFYPEALPAPTFGTPGLMWASLTLAILTLPVVIVATEEGLARIPRTIREGSLALGATKAETLWRTVIPMASPAIMTGMILAIARAAGEVAPLMLVGVVKLAPSLPLDGNYPFLHLERKFMHLGFHIYDVGFQSPNVEAARPLVYATALLLVLVIVILNLAAITIRNHLREKNRALES